MQSDYQVLLYYKYVTIADPEAFMEEQRALCQKWNLKGRIIVAHEGLNGTLSGFVEDTEQYVKAMQENPLFADMIFKKDRAEKGEFPRLSVKVRSEIVSLKLGENDVDPNELTGEHLKPLAFREALLDEQTVVIDARNDYEYDLGHFRGAVRPDIRSFRELPEWILNHREELMEKRVVTYCTGGVRCEKLTGWLLKEGFKDVAQLDGGIATYSKAPETKGDLWDGAMYVFDERISVPINQHEHVIIGKDWFDGTPCERYINCANPYCNRQILASKENEEKYLGSCSHECRIHPANRYIKAHQLTNADLVAALEKIGEVWPLKA